MRLLKYIPLLSLVFSTGILWSQIEGSNAFLRSKTVEIGIHELGFEGSEIGPIDPDHSRSGYDPALGFVANPQEDDWTNYDGDFYLPGAPENGFGIEIDGTNYRNSRSPFFSPTNAITSDGLSNYEEFGRCKLVDWDGSVAGVDIHQTYRLDTTGTYYTVDVTLTNTTGSDMEDVYFFKSFDPDNNQPIGWSFMTTNTIEFQPTPFCPKSLVSATQSNTWDNYVGFAAIDVDTRVSWGGFTVLSGSDIWNGEGGLTGTPDATIFCDCAISISHKDAVLAAGASSNFQFVVIMSSEQVEEAIQSLYYVDYPESPGALAGCVDALADTIDLECSDGAATLSLDGPYLGLGYEITWYNDDTGEEVGEGPTLEVVPGDAATYRVEAVPVGDCFELPIVRYIVVQGVGIGPHIVLEDPGPQCYDVDLADLVFYDENGLPGIFTEFYSEYPDSIDHPFDIWPEDDLIGPGDEVFILMGDAESGCYDINLVVIEFIEVNAGLDSTGHELCNSGIETADLNTFLVDTILLASEGSMWEEITPTGGGFNPVTGIFDPTGLAAGDYDIRFIGLGGMICDNDTSIHTITVYHQPNAGEDNVAELCNVDGESIDLNTLLFGHEPGGTWTEVDPTAGAFDPATGVLSLDGTLAAGDYVFEYTIFGTSPCIDDVAQFTITLNAIPAVTADASDPNNEICIGDEVSVYGIGDPATYVWDPATVTNGIPFTPAVGETTYTVTATDANGCVNTDEITIIVHDLPDVNFRIDTTFGCTPFDVVLNVETPASTDILAADWTFGDGDVAFGMVSPTVSHTYLYEGEYDVNLTITDINGCVNSMSAPGLVSVKTQPIARFTMDPQSVFTNDTEVDFTNESSHATDYTWNFGDGSDESNVENPTHFFPEDPGDVFYPITLTATNEFGCPDVATLYMNVKGIILFYIPNTFTPDGDQFNETFQPVFESGFDPYDFHMVIYNRWGEMVFETFDATRGWNGLYGNQGLVKDGVYTWQVDFKEGHTDARHMHNGHVTILK